MSEHTPEPWHYTKTGELVRAADGDWPAWNICEMNTLTSRYAANARRIVACVNACRGIETKVLEDSKLQTVIAQSLASDIRAKEAERLLEDIIDSYDDTGLSSDVWDFQMSVSINQARAFLEGG